METIFALSSGLPPAGIGVIRISGPQASVVLKALTGKLPLPRHASRVKLRDAAGALLDDGLAVYFPAPRSATGEDLAEFHCHGGRAVIVAVEAAIAQIPGCRRALPGEFTRRAFANGRIDLAEAEGLGDLLAAETELQRRSAMTLAGGAFSRQVDGWRERLLGLSALLEAVLNFAEEDDITTLPDAFGPGLEALGADLAEALQAPHAELVREGFRVALAGPPNVGKSTLFNALVGVEAAITTDIAGTTRDVLVKPVAISGVPFSFVDMAGLRSDAADAVEAIGIARAREELAQADLVLWLGKEGAGPAGAWEIAAQCDRSDSSRGVTKERPDFRVSAVTGEGMEPLRGALVERARAVMPRPGQAALNARQRQLLGAAGREIAAAGSVRDPLLIAEHLRLARSAFDGLLGQTGTEDLLDAIFGRFCLGK